MGLILVFLRFLFIALYLVLLGRVIWSWIDPTYRGPIGRFLFEASEPILAPIRRVLPRTGTIDWSPIVAFIGLTILAGLFGLR